MEGGYIALLRRYKGHSDKGKEKQMGKFGRRIGQGQAKGGRMGLVGGGSSVTVSDSSHS